MDLNSENPWHDDSNKPIPIKTPEIIVDGWKNSESTENRGNAGFESVILNETTNEPQNILNSANLMNIPLSKSPDRKSSSLTNLSSNQDIEHARYYSQEDLVEKLHQGFSKGLTSAKDENGINFTNKSQTLSNIQNIFSDAQKIAYVGLCFLAMNEAKSRLKSKSAIENFEKWIQIFMEKLYVYLDLNPEGKNLMIPN